jgi:hypothetical protein
MVVGRGTTVFWAVWIAVVEDPACGSSAMAGEQARLSPTEAMVARMMKRSTMATLLREQSATV